MGWWSTGIMAGDSPLDWEDEIYGLCGVEKWQEDSDKMVKIPKSILEVNTPKIVRVIERESGWEKQIAYQVLGVMLMRSGCEIEEALKADIISAAHLDEWATEDGERRKSCDEFVTRLKSYGGKPTETPSKGLFEVFAEAIRDGQQEGGLINKIPPHHD
jgi:hypothetical protein